MDMVRETFKKIMRIGNILDVYSVKENAVKNGFDS